MSQMKIYTREPDGTIAFKPVSEVPDAQFTPMGQATPAVEERTNQKLPFTGPYGIFCRYLDSKLILEGKGTVVPDSKYLPTFTRDAREMIEATGVANVTSGFYNWGQGGKEQLFLNLGMGAVLYCGLPDYDGDLWLDYYGDTLGLRSFSVTPHAIKAELLQDLNEAFKMLEKYQAEKHK